MTKRYITATFDGKTFKRQTDRPYTHALVLTQFNPEPLRQRAMACEPQEAKQTEKNIAWHRKQAALGVGGTVQVTGCARPWSYAQSEKDHAGHVAYLGDKSDEQLMAEAAAGRASRLEALIKHLTAKGNDVLSWHGSLTLAHKARDAAVPKQPAYRIEVVAVNQQ